MPVIYFRDMYEHIDGPLCQNCLFCCNVWDASEHDNKSGGVVTPYIVWTCAWNLRYEKHKQQPDQFAHSGCANFVGRARDDGGKTCTMEKSFIELATLEHMQEWLCSECGEYTTIQVVFDKDEQPSYCCNCGARNTGARNEMEG